MMDFVMRFIATRTFAYAWIGILFAIYGGMVYGAAPDIIWTFTIGFGCVVIAGYNLGRVIGFIKSQYLLDQVIEANNSLADALTRIYEEHGSPEPPHDDGTACREEE